MSDAVRRGYCPTALQPMESGDGLLIRVKPTLGALRPHELALLANLAETHGNGLLELTRRGGIQLRGFSEESVEEATDALVENGLVVKAPELERKNNLLISPFRHIDPKLAKNLSKVTVSLHIAILSDFALNALPAKFGFAVDGGGSWRLPSEGSDVVLRRTTMKGAHGWALELGGQLYRITGDPAAGAVALAHAFLRLREGETRIAQLLKRVPAERLVSMAGHKVRPLGPAEPCPAPSPGAVHFDDVAALLIAFPFGTLTAEQARALADLARFGSELQTTPWRALVFGPLDIAGAEAMADRCQELGAIVEGADPRLRVAACIGAPRCASGKQATRAFAAAVAARLPSGKTAHVSGCAKGCAASAAANVTLVGTASGWDLVRDGRVSDAPEGRDLSDASVLEALSANG